MACQSQSEVLFGHLLAAVCWIGDELLSFVVDDEVQYFQRDLTQKIGHGLGHFDDIKVFRPAHEFELHRFAFKAHYFSVGCLRPNCIDSLQAKLLDHGRFEIQSGGACIDQARHFCLARFLFRDVAFE